ncbi:hypothetical protein GALMADRAFT_247011 [Galerina marginata CBS 339.88]|uniref:Benzoate 4-monooxygenase cytochrome P450 n=1 Tax=Galerina marginata (strain CBS 339.88) TaxID=685588 RepID=A0A067TC78_GALM3|nr:hypothetical protein GALMADRAFT_247011 [Galerina marginata CBS 339.88]
MNIIDIIFVSAKPEHLWLVLAGIVVLFFIHRSMRVDPLQKIPGPWLAKYTSFLLAYHARTGKRYLYIDQLHKKYGPFVRITPSQVSCAQPAALPIIYAHGASSLPKTTFYRAFYFNGAASLFSTQDRVSHASKRRVLAHPLSYASVKQYEGWIRTRVAKLVAKLDQKAQAGGLEVGAAKVGKSSGKVVSGVRAASDSEVDVRMWINCLTFDVISDLAFGEPLGVLDRGSDVLAGGEDEAPGIAAMIESRGRSAAFLGLFPYLLPGSIMAPLARWVPDANVQRAFRATDTVSQIAQRCVQRRLQSSAARRGDLLDWLVDDMRTRETRFPDGLGAQDKDTAEAEVVTDAMLLFTTGADTTADSITAIIFWVYSTPRVLNKLRDEVRKAFSTAFNVESEDEKEKKPTDLFSWIPSHDQIKDLEYLNATIDESLRIFATNAFGMPRIVPDGMSVSIEGTTFYAGTELSSPAYTIQHDPAIWGADADTFRPERWLEPGSSQLKKYLLTFGVGPRMCIGKNLAVLQMQILVATFVMRYDLVLRDEKELRSVEGFMHKPADLWAKVKLSG